MVVRLCLACGYSVYELAEAANVSVWTIQRLECGKPIDKRTLPARHERQIRACTQASVPFGVVRFM